MPAYRTTRHACCQCVGWFQFINLCYLTIELIFITLDVRVPMEAVIFHPPIGNCLCVPVYGMPFCMPACDNSRPTCVIYRLMLGINSVRSTVWMVETVKRKSDTELLIRSYDWYVKDDQKTGNEAFICSTRARAHTQLFWKPLSLCLDHCSARIFSYIKQNFQTLSQLSASLLLL